MNRIIQLTLLLLFLGNIAFSQSLQQEIPADYGYIVELGQTVPEFEIKLPNGTTTDYTFAEQGAGVTRNVIIDKEGKIVFMTRLFKEEEFEEMKKVINQLLKL